MALKKIFVGDLLVMAIPTEVEVQGWVQSRRHQGGIIFLDLFDSTGLIQVVIEKKNISSSLYGKIHNVPLESCVFVRGNLRGHSKKSREIELRDFTIINSAEKQFSPQPRGRINVFDPDLTDHLLSKRHIYLRNPQTAAFMKFRDLVKRKFRYWFEDNGFFELDAPILTPVPLYEDKSAMSISVHGEQIFLTQCVGFYLEAAAEALERVYNMGPSFRGEESRSRRHLMEYHHVKAEIAFGNLEDMIRLIESMLSEVTYQIILEAEPLMKNLRVQLSLEATKIPYERITYREAIKQLRDKGHRIKFGEGIGSCEEEALSELIPGPFWIVGPPRKTEPFPYVINQDDPEIVNVADLIAPRGFGEILDAAEKIHDIAMLKERMAEKGKLDDPRYEWVKEMRLSGFSPHIAFGMGLERYIRWVLGLSHVRDAIAFPRIIRRRVYP